LWVRKEKENGTSGGGNTLKPNKQKLVKIKKQKDQNKKKILIDESLPGGGEKTSWGRRLGGKGDKEKMEKRGNPKPKKKKLNDQTFELGGKRAGRTTEK